MAEERKVFEARVEKQEWKPGQKGDWCGAEAWKPNPGADLKFGDWRLVIS